MQGGRLPDLKALRRCLRQEVGNAFSVRGVEATVKGRLIEQNGRLAVRVSDTAEVFPPPLLSSIHAKLDPCQKGRKTLRSINL
jgi:hypothetical protein